MSDIGPRAPQAKAAAPAPSAAAPSVKKAEATKAKPATRTTAAAHQVHHRAQRSHTLHRAALKRPEPLHQNKPRPAVRRSDMIQRFAPIQPQPVPSKQSQVQATATNTAKAPAAPRSEVTAVAPRTQHAAAPAPQKAAPLQGSALKEQLIKNRMDEAVAHEKAEKPTKAKSHTSHPKSRRRASTIASGVAALVLLGGYLTYLNLPSLSIRVAAARANVNANYPSYQPAGYSFAGPVAFSPGEVRVNFQSNTNDYDYSLVQRSSNWDSQAVLDNYVLEETEQYATLQERGLTIYLMERKAAWVNGGTLYVIEGDAPLSSEQIQKIASSTI